MSTESAKAFIQKMASDESFRTKIEKAANDAERQKAVKAAGFDFTKNELKSVIPGTSGQGELSEKDLEAVAGGSSAAWVAVAVGTGGAVAASA
jgi:predicted ribosomally synthesized peptide with nif11-like leader